VIYVISGSRRLDPRFHREAYEVLKLAIRHIAADARAVYHGGAKGVDSVARELCFRYLQRNVPVIEVPARWAISGKAAGLLRNREMLRLAQQYAAWLQVPVKLLAFPCSQSIGTHQCIKTARKLTIDCVTMPLGELLEVQCLSLWSN